MADDPPPPSPDAATQAVLDAIQAASPSGGSYMPLTTATNNASNAQTNDPAVNGVLSAVQNASPSSFTPPPGQDGILNRSWKSIAGGIMLPHMPGTDAPDPVFPDNAPIQEPPLFAGVRRGVRDVIDTGAHGLATVANLIPGVNVDVDALRASDKADRDAWSAANGDSTGAGVGRVIGQIAATGGPLREATSLLARGATMIPGAVGDAARFLTGAAPIEGASQRAGQLAAQGAQIGAGQAALTSSASDQSTPEQLAGGAITGAAAGPVLGGLTKAIDVLRGFTPAVRPDIAGLADTARQYGVDIPLPLMSGNRTTRIMTDATKGLPFSGADDAALGTQRQFQGAMARQMGSTADQFGPTTMDETAGRLSNGYNDLYTNAPPIAGGQPLSSGLTNIGNDAARFLVGDQAGAMAHVDNAITNVANAFSGGSLDPQAYKSLMGANDGTLARIENAAPSAASPYLAAVRQAVQNRFAASAGPDAAATLKTLDSQWRAMKTIEPLAATSTTGDISPGGLTQRVVNASNRFDPSTGGVAYTGGGPLGDLGKVGKQFLGTIPESGTAPREQVYNFARNPYSFLPTAAMGALSRLPMNYLRSPTLAGRVIDTSLGGPTPDISRLLPYGLLGPIDRERPNQ